MPKVIEVVNIHSLKVNQILYSKLLPEQVISIAKEFHRDQDLVGVVDEDVESLRFDECFPNKYDVVDVFGKRIWEVKVEYASWLKRYTLFIDDDLGEVVAYSTRVFMGFVNNGVFSDCKIKVSNKKCNDFYPCYLKRTDYDDPDNISDLKVLDKYRQEFIKENSFYYPDEKGKKFKSYFLILLKLCASVGVVYWIKSLFS